MFEKTTKTKEIMHGLHKIFYFDREKAFMHYFYYICLWVFVCHNVHFLADFLRFLKEDICYCH